VVHFICHGGFENARPYVQLHPEEVTDAPPRVFADALLLLLQSGGTPPPVVVLNACATGTAEAAPSHVAAPFAVDLVRGGVAVVVGMTGRVTDRACRLFSRSFYESLVDGKSFVQATAIGRRAGLVGGGDPASAVDWALPAIFMSESVDAGVDLDDPSGLALRETRARAFAKMNNPPSFCGRIDCIEAYHDVADGRGVSPPRVLAIDPNFTSPQYGKTRLLQELAAQACRDGDVPVLISFPPTSELPKNALDLSRHIIKAIIDTRRTFGLPALAPADFQLMRLAKRINEKADIQLADEVEMELALQEGTPVASGRVVGAALRADLAALATAATPATPAGVAPVRPRILVLIDEIHRLGAATKDLLEGMIDDFGFGTSAAPIPLVVAYSAQSGDNIAMDAIRGFLTRGRGARHVRIGAFRQPVEDWIAYQQTLLDHKPPLVMKQDADESDIENFYQTLRQLTGGIPSKLESSEGNRDVQLIIDTARGAKSFPLFPMKVLLAEADDEAALAIARQVIG
jgi:hypothetical protein